MPWIVECILCSTKNYNIDCGNAVVVLADKQAGQICTQIECFNNLMKNHINTF